VQDSNEARPSLARQYRLLWVAIAAILVADVVAAIVLGFPHYPSLKFEPLAPLVVFKVGPFNVTNSIVTTWVIGTILVVLAVALTRGLRLIPGTVQNAVEWLYESLANFVVGLGGPEAKRYVPLFVALFLFILVSNWSGVIPFFGKVEWLRAPTSDLNVTAGLALVSFLIFHIEGVRTLGLRRYLGKFFNLSGFRHGPTDGAIDLFVGLNEIPTELFKPLTLSLRLFGNVWGGEVMLSFMTGLLLAILPLPFLGLELFIGLIQAFIFAILTLVFTLLASESHDQEHPAAEAPSKATTATPAAAAA
jgi:F-type H+-transporting ATPase subunit a